MKGCRIPGPAGDDDVFLIEAKNKSDSNIFNSTLRLNNPSSGRKDATTLPLNGKRSLVEGSEFEVIQISEGLLGELLLTVRNGTSVTQISVTSKAKAMFASVLPGDTICLDKVNIIASHHSKPLYLVCVDDIGSQNHRADKAFMPDSKVTLAGTSQPQGPEQCQDSECNASEQQYSSQQANDEKDEVDELLEGVSF